MTIRHVTALLTRATATLGLLALLAACAGGAPGANRELILLSTTTTRDTGLLDALVPDFEKRTGYTVKQIIAGSGEILKLGERGEGDVVLSHSPAAEEAWMAAGHGTRRALVMHNDFVMVGPANDPAQVRGLAAAEALRKIALAGAAFISRGDQSGTHVKELALWREAGVEPKGRSWYQETGAGQGQTLNVASEKGAYALADRGTYLALKKGLSLEILVEKDNGLSNIYHVMTVNPAKSPKINADGANAFADYLVSPVGQELIRTFGVAQYGQPLFVPDAGKSESQVLQGKP
ncbi:MAG: substrate-binding domain-containing protein [Chloroflexi bacterium]|nr:substrate-binding domain-containing protein [Chloroflexota bacterium]